MNPKTLERLRKTRYGKEKNALAQDLLGIASENGLDLNAVARAAQLSPTTLRKLQQNETMFVHFLTFWKLSGALGLSLTSSTRKGRKAIDVKIDTGRKRKKRKKKARGKKRRS